MKYWPLLLFILSLGSYECVHNIKHINVSTDDITNDHEFYEINEDSIDQKLEYVSGIQEANGYIKQILEEVHGDTIGVPFSSCDKFNINGVPFYIEIDMDNDDVAVTTGGLSMIYSAENNSVSQIKFAFRAMTGRDITGYSGAGQFYETIKIPYLFDCPEDSLNKEEIKLKTLGSIADKLFDKTIYLIFEKYRYELSLLSEWEINRKGLSIFTSELPKNDEQLKSAFGEYAKASCGLLAYLDDSMNFGSDISIIGVPITERCHLPREPDF